MQGGKFGLLIACSKYQDPEFQQLRAPGSDVTALERILADPVIGGFQIKVVEDLPSYQVEAEVETFFAARQNEDLVLLYFSGHGIKNRHGEWSFAAVDPQRGRNP